MSETVVNLPAAIPQKREIQNVIDAVPILDTSRFEHMQRIARVMASSSMIPETLRATGPKDKREDLPFEQVLSNCFLVVNQAARWGMDPFAVISCCSVVHGRLSYEGKLVSAVLDAKLGIELHHHFTGNPHGEDYRIYLSDQPFTDEIIAELKPGFSKNGWRIFDGSVAEWKTTGTGSPWSSKNYKRMLIYRGTRDWARIYKSALMLGVYSDDEMLDLMEDARARRATPVLSLADRLAASTGTKNGDGFSHDHVTRETNGHAKESAATKGDASHSEPPQDATIAQAETPAEQPAGETGHAGEAPATEPNSSLPTAPQVVAGTDAPATEHAAEPMVAGEQPQESSRAEHADGEGVGDGVSESTASSPNAGLPPGWAITYAAALRRAQKPDSLAKYATEYWKQYGGWPAHKDTPDGATAAAIFNAFRDNFGNREQIELLLRELI